MAAGVNYNNVWAALGTPDRRHQGAARGGEHEDFHIGGSDASGVVWAVGKDVTNVKVGDEVVVHCGVWARRSVGARARSDVRPEHRIWGYETNWGSFAQFTRCRPTSACRSRSTSRGRRPAAYMLVGATAYRMLIGWPPNVVEPGDVVLVWGGAGGLGSMAIQITRAAGGLPVAVVSDDDKRRSARSSAPSA